MVLCGRRFDLRYVYLTRGGVCLCSSFTPLLLFST